METKTTIIFQSIKYATLLAALAIVGFLGFMHLRFQAINDCYTTSKFQKTIANEGIVVSYPLVDTVTECFAKKGL